MPRQEVVSNLEAGMDRVQPETHLSFSLCSAKTDKFRVGLRNKPAGSDLEGLNVLNILQAA